jgi:hypothetical protein
VADTADGRECEILDFRPKAFAPRCANMLAMNGSALNPPVSAPRRFLLLPEEAVSGRSGGPKIRRYKLVSIGQRARLSSRDLATARVVREFGRLGRA